MLEGSFGGCKVEYDKRKGENFCNWEERHFGNWEEEYSDSRLLCNKPSMDFVKVKNDLGMIMIFSGSSSPLKKQL